MKRLWNRRGGGGRVAKRVAVDVVESMARDGTKAALKRLPEFCLCVAEQGWPYAATAFAGCVPVVGSALALGGIALYKHRKDQKSDAEERAHYRALADALREISGDQKAAIEKLIALGEQRPFVWTEVTTEDPAAAAAQVTAAFRAAGFDGTVTVRDLMGEIREVRKDVAGVKHDTEAIRRDQATKDDLAAMEERILKRIEENKKSLVDPTKLEWPPELIEQAKILRERGDKEQRAIAEIALRNHEEADRLIQELKKDPIAEAFRLLRLEGDNWMQANEPDKAVEPYEQALALRPDDIRARNNTTIAHACARLGDLTAHRRRAIGIAEHTLTLLAPASADWAMTQNNLGNAWLDLPTGDRGENIRKAIAAYEAALTVYTRDAHPTAWAATQNNLGNAWSDLPTGDRAGNLTKVIAAFEAALTVWTHDTHPTEWAVTQGKLGTVWANLPTGDRADNLTKAIAAFEAALTVWTHDTAPDKQALTLSQIGTAWAGLPTGDRTNNLRKAIDAYETALTVWTRDSNFIGWALTLTSIGAAWASLPTGDRTNNLRKAIDAYETALTAWNCETNPVHSVLKQAFIRYIAPNFSDSDRLNNLMKAIDTSDVWSTIHHDIDKSWSAPHANDPAYTEKILFRTYKCWGIIQEKLGKAWANLPSGDRADNLKKAIHAYEAALTMWTRDAHPVNWAITQNNLGAAWSDLPIGDRTENIRKAIAAYEAALTVWSRDVHPAHWAFSQALLGDAWRNLPTGDRVNNLRKAIDAYEAALTACIWETAHDNSWARIQHNLGAAWADLPTGDRAYNIRKAIDAYEAASTVWSSDVHPDLWAVTQHILGDMWMEIPVGNHADNINKSIDAYEAALTVHTHDVHPDLWAEAQHNLGIAWTQLAALPGQDACDCLRRSIAAYKAALTVRTLEVFPHDHAQTARDLAATRAAYESGGYSAAVPFDDIPPAG